MKKKSCTKYYIGARYYGQHLLEFEKDTQNFFVFMACLTYAVIRYSVVDTAIRKSE